MEAESPIALACWVIIYILIIICIACVPIIDFIFVIYVIACIPDIYANFALPFVSTLAALCIICGFVAFTILTVYVVTALLNDKKTTEKNIYCMLIGSSKIIAYFILYSFAISDHFLRIAFFLGSAANIISVMCHMWIYYCSETPK